MKNSFFSKQILKLNSTMKTMFRSPIDIYCTLEKQRLSTLSTNYILITQHY